SPPTAAPPTSSYTRYDGRTGTKRNTFSTRKSPASGKVLTDSPPYGSIDKPTTRKDERHGQGRSIRRPCSKLRSLARRGSVGSRPGESGTGPHRQRYRQGGR